MWPNLSAQPYDIQARTEMPTPPQFLVRDAGAVDSDGPFVISTFDAALPFLDSIGNHEQLGSTPFSHRQGWAKEILQQIRDSEHDRLTGNGDGGGLRIFIVERECPAQGAETLDVGQVHSRVAVDGLRFLSVGFAFVRENWFPSYITSQCHLYIGDAELRDRRLPRGHGHGQPRRHSAPRRRGGTNP